MMLKVAEKAELNQISLTGVRSIVILGLLIIAPRSLKEIEQAFLNANIIEENHSDDIIRIDMNTLKSFGCKISRPCALNNYKYVLEEHPFSFPITIEHIKLLKKIYNKLKQTSDIKKLIEYDLFFKKINNFVFDEELKEAMAGISVLKYYNIDLIEELNLYCKKKYIIKISYKKPSSPEATVKNIVALELLYKNDKIYLYGYDIDKKRLVTLNLNRILAILSKQKNDNNIIIPNGYTIKFKLFDYKNIQLENNEKIIKTNDEYIIVEGFYYNDFYAMQRVLSLKEKCVVIEPENFKEIIISKLKEMSKIYEK